MSDFSSFRSIIELWGPKDAHGARLTMALEIGASAAVVTKWWQRDWIPADWWSAVLSAERIKAAGITADDLARLAARHVVEARA